MSALPSGNAITGHLPEGSTARGVYDSVVLPAERAATEAGSAVHVMHTRVVGYLLLYAPKDRARDVLSSEIACCGGQYEALYSLGEMYLKSFIRPCKS